MIGVTRRGLAVSILGVAAPIGLLAVAWVADQLFHRHGCPPPPRAPAAALVEFDVVADGDSDVEAHAVFATDLTIPELRRQLLAERAFHGWESPTPDRPEILYGEEQFLRQRLLMLRIVQLSGLPLRDAIKLSPAERLQLRQDAAGCDGWRAATWLLHELDGAPLPRTAYNRAKRLACEGAWLPGDSDVE